MPRSLIFRAGSVATALATVWCLGCSSFEPLMSALMERTMPCDETTQVLAMVGADDGSTDVASQAGAVSAVAERGASGMDCGCAQTCVAASLGTTAPLQPPVDAPFLFAVVAAHLPSIDRAPLIPPPELITA